MIYRIDYNGTWLSTNTIYSKNRFAANKIKDEWKMKFSTMFKQAGITPFTTFLVTLKYWSRIDCENVTAGLKVEIDQLRYESLILNDDKRYYKGLIILPTPELKHNTYQVSIYTDDDCTDLLEKLNNIL